MTSYKLFLLPGDGIGPEVMKEAEAVIAWFNGQGIARFEIERGLVGGAAYDAHGKAISEADMATAMAADAVLFGAVGGPKMGQGSLRRRARKRAFCGCARISASSPICGRRSAIRHSPMPPRSSAKSSKASIS